LTWDIIAHNGFALVAPQGDVVQTSLILNAYQPLNIEVLLTWYDWITVFLDRPSSIVSFNNSVGFGFGTEGKRGGAAFQPSNECHLLKSDTNQIPLVVKGCDVTNFGLNLKNLLLTPNRNHQGR